MAPLGAAVRHSDEKGIFNEVRFYYENEGFTLKLPRYTGQSPAPLTAATPLRHAMRAVRNPFRSLWGATAREDF